MTGRNKEGYPDPTASKAIRAADRMPQHTYKDYCILRAMAYRMGLQEIPTGIFTVIQALS